MKILGIVCSPRKNGNTEILVKEALKVAQEAGCETEIFLLSEKKVAPCLACGTCFRTGACVQKDDMQELVKMFETASGIILGTPVYFHNVSAQAKAVMDRTFALLMKRPLKGKAAGAIVTTRRIGASQTRALVYDFFIAHGMIVAGGSIGYGPNPGDVLTGVGGGINISAMEEARSAGKDVVELAFKLQGASRR
jgi:multimeric flavodoxin WrbA